MYSLRNKGINKSNIKDISVANFGNKINKRAQNIVSDETIKWIIYIAILVAAGFAVRQIVSKVTG